MGRAHRREIYMKQGMRYLLIFAFLLGGVMLCEAKTESLPVQQTLNEEKVQKKQRKAEKDKKEEEKNLLKEQQRQQKLLKKERLKKERLERHEQQQAKETLSQDGDKKAKLHFLETSHDFGNVPRKGGDLVYEFRFRNEGSIPLVLLRVLTTCSCLRGQYAKRPVMPGEEAVVKVVYEPHKAEPGAFNKVLRILSNSEKGDAVLTVQGNSIEDDARLNIRHGKLRK